ncbi:MBL fold metallo-hydrolase [Duganella callida]|uniref:MBL fold metallo-hydrolase n=1 Tax=Duganella callida TaxID=2561932 RepID=A0A4Y9S3C6_9BURK|nr:MBL fold metallo-hydrolase [Duganella callida]TFW15804.1 MBL fold metallo-hydrolase [Duganella callida]
MKTATVFRPLVLAAAVALASSAWFAPAQAADASSPVVKINDATAKADVNVETLRGNISVLSGSGGNIIVYNSAQGKFVVDAGIAVSKDKIAAVLNGIGPGPLKYLVNTHYHWDHTDGNAWMHAAGATIIGAPMTALHLSKSTRVDDWNYTFDPLPMAARPSIIVKGSKTMNFGGERIAIQNFGKGHTDGDLWVYFKQADVLALGDTFWNNYYPFIDNEHGGSIDTAIVWANKAIDASTDHTIIVPGHGATGNRADLIAWRDMLVDVRGKVATLKQQGKSLDEIVAANPTAAYDAKYGGFVINGGFFTKLVYDGLNGK